VRRQGRLVLAFIDRPLTEGAGGRCSFRWREGIDLNFEDQRGERMESIRWNLYARIAALESARNWIEIQQKLLRAPKTIDAYARGLDDFVRVCQQRSVRIESATKGDIACYVEDLATRPRSGDAKSNGDGAAGLANKTILQRLTAVRLFYDFLMETGVRTTNPVGRGRYTPGSGFYGLRHRALVPRYQRPPWIPNGEQWQAFLEYTVREEPLRNQIMVFIAYDGALRRSELLSLMISDIDFPHQKITIRPEVAKYRSSRVVFYSDATSDLLSAYVRCRSSLPSLRRDSLFVSESRRNSGAGLTFEMWNKIVRRIAEQTGLPQFTTHTFRHLRLTDLARCRLELYEIATYAGHRNPKTTQQYIHLSGEELRQRIQRATRSIDERNRRLLERIRGNDGKS
jgi:site-specific recombinase XerD